MCSMGNLLLRMMVSQPPGHRLRRSLFYFILIFVPIITVTWLRTTTPAYLYRNIPSFEPQPPRSFPLPTSIPNTYQMTYLTDLVYTIILLRN
ncbi:hypothetical protein ARMSODRAFT_506807 [Armillaria solidipes]|uniref:Uncharacterized protein n=1 Tax=Armillaria solidipes TaxID=1076256 RepID=A0A2H3C9X4_9AGAR|nr:hypothetical protein ARMSODRAFT_506807 [Armillaria solidipes]